MEYIIQLFNLLKENQFLSGGVMLGILASIFYPLKALPYMIWNKIKFYFTYQIYMDQSDEIYNVFSDWFNKKYPDKFRNVEVRFVKNKSQYYEGKNEKLTKKKWQLWKFQYLDTNCIWYNNRLLWIYKNRKELTAAKDVFDMFLNSYQISGLFAKKAIEKLCEELIELKTEEEGSDGIDVYILSDVYNRDFKKSNLKIHKSFDNIFFKGKKEYLKNLDDFISKKDFYHEKEIQYKRSYLLHGKGGTGKSSIAGATAKYLDYDIYLVNLHSLNSDKDLVNAITGVPPKSIILIEDIDCYLSNRDVKNEKINFSTILNIMDGLYSPSDCIFMITTNKLEELDDALIRKGRVDSIMYIDYPRVQDVEDFMSNFYEEKIKLNILTFDKPMVDVQEICLNSTKEEAIKEIESMNNKFIEVPINKPLIINGSSGNTTVLPKNATLHFTENK